MENDVISFNKPGILDDPSKKWWLVILPSGIWNCRIAIMFILYSWVRTFTFNIWYLYIYFKYIRETCIRIWYLLPLILLISYSSHQRSHKKWISLALFWIRSERPWPVLCWYLLVAYLRSLYLNMGTSGIVFRPISPVIRLPWRKTKFLWPFSHYVAKR